MSKIYSKIDFPKKAIFIRDENTLYFEDDFEDGEKVEFAYYCEKPCATAIGNAWYCSLEPNKSKVSKLINIKDLRYY